MWSFAANAREYCTNVNFIMETNAQYNMNGVCNTIPLLQFALDGRERYIQYAYGFFFSLFTFNRIILSPALTSKLPWATSSRLLLPHKPLSFQQFCMCEFAHYNECVLMAITKRRKLLFSFNIKLMTLCGDQRKDTITGIESSKGNDE